MQRLGWDRLLGRRGKRILVLLLIWGRSGRLIFCMRRLFRLVRGLRRRRHMTTRPKPNPSNPTPASASKDGPAPHKSISAYHKSTTKMRQSSRMSIRGGLIRDLEGGRHYFRSWIWMRCWYWSRRGLRNFLNSMERTLLVGRGRVLSWEWSSFRKWVLGVIKKLR